MRLVSYHSVSDPEPRVAILDGSEAVDLAATWGLPKDMLGLLRYASTQTGPGDLHPLAWLVALYLESTRPHTTIPLEDLQLAAPLPSPTSLRDFYAFEDHVRDARARRGLEMIPEWYEQPVFYFSNHQAIVGPDEAVERPRTTEWLDFELEVAAIIGRQGRDIPVVEAERYIAGYTIMNDWSARDLQRQEMKVGLGPAKGKDFATSLGPWLVTPDELEERREGKGFDLAMIARRNGRVLSRGNWRSITFSFAEMIARASESVTLYPGDVIGSGTVGSGCILELGPDEAGGWLRAGDEIELEVERLGILRNTIVEPGTHSS